MTILYEDDDVVESYDHENDDTEGKEFTANQHQNDLSLDNKPVEDTEEKEFTANAQQNDRLLLKSKPVEERLHLIIGISNPCQFERRYMLAKQFIRRIKKMKNVLLYIVEIAYDLPGKDPQEFRVTNPRNPRHLQVRSSDPPLWAKENMWNMGVKHLLPSGWKVVAFSDADIEFDNIHFARDTLKILNGDCDVVQMHSHCIDINAKGGVATTYTSFAFSVCHQQKYIASDAKFFHTGHTVAMTRVAYKKTMNGIFDRAIVGSGDGILFHSIQGTVSNVLQHQECSDGYKNSILDFQERCASLRIGYVPGFIYHHYHGKKENRAYLSRFDILKTHGYDPQVHVEKRTDGLLIPSPQCPPAMLEDISRYFQERKEDDMLVGNISRPFSFRYLTIQQALLENSPLEKKLHMIIGVSNPCLYERRYELAEQFIQRMERMNHVLLYIVEIVYDLPGKKPQKFRVTHSKNPRHLQVRTSEPPLWAKENMWNMGVRHLLPEDWKAVAFCDADVEFENVHLARDTLKILNGVCDVVQLHSHRIDLKSRNNMHYKNMEECYGYRFFNGKGGGHPGHTVAMTRAAFEKLGGFFERAIIGSGDSIFLEAFRQRSFRHRKWFLGTSVSEYYSLFKGLRLGYVPGIIIHSFHGSRKNRKYTDRHQLTKKYKYDPTLHVENRKDGLLVPSRRCPQGLTESIMKYFWERNEDEGSDLIPNTNTKTKVIFITRFSIFDANTKGFRKPVKKEYLFSEERLKARFEIFEKNYVPSIHRQNYSDCEWYVMTSSHLPEKYSKRLERVVGSIPNVHIIPVENFAEFRETINTKLRNESNYISVRVDDDDGLAPTFASRLVDIAKNNRNAEVISFTRGRKCSLSKKGELIISSKQVYSRNSAQGLAAVNKNIYSFGNHNKVHEKTTVHYDHTPNMYNVFCSEWTDTKRKF